MADIYDQPGVTYDTIYETYDGNVTPAPSGGGPPPFIFGDTRRWIPLMDAFRYAEEEKRRRALLAKQAPVVDDFARLRQEEEEIALVIALLRP